VSFGDWKLEKSVQALIDEAQAMADRLESGKAHVIESYASFAQVWAVTFYGDGQDLRGMAGWSAVELKRFITTIQSKIAALRKQRLYDSSDGLAVWLHTARAVSQPRIVPAVGEIWRLLQSGGSNATAMTEDILQDAGLPTDHPPFIPPQFVIA
jgi:hypothetical protein